MVLRRIKGEGLSRQQTRRFGVADRAPEYAEQSSVPKNRVSPPQDVVGGNVILQPTTVKQIFLRALLSHHAHFLTWTQETGLNLLGRVK